MEIFAPFLRFRFTYCVLQYVHHIEMNCGQSVNVFFLYFVCQIGSFEHNLTTDLLNHLVFLQRVFMKEVNEVIQKVSGTKKLSSIIKNHNDKLIVELNVKHGRVCVQELNSPFPCGMNMICQLMEKNLRSCSIPSA